MLLEQALGFRLNPSSMITAAQPRAARALSGIDQRKLAELSGTLGPDDPAHGSEGRPDPRERRLPREARPRHLGRRRGTHRRGRGQRPRRARRQDKTAAIQPRGPGAAVVTLVALGCAGALLGISVLALLIADLPGRSRVIYGCCLGVAVVGFWSALHGVHSEPTPARASPGTPLDRRKFPSGRPQRSISRRRQLRSRWSQPIRAGVRGARACAYAGPSVLPGVPGWHEPRAPRGRRILISARVGVHVVVVVGARHGAPRRRRTICAPATCTW